MLDRIHNLLRLSRRHPRLAVLTLALLILGAGAGGIFLWAQYHFNAAQQALERFSLDEAQQHLDLCLLVRSGSAPVHLLAAQTARRRDAYGEAEHHLATCIRLEGMTAATALERFLLKAQQGDLGDVEPLLKRRIDADDPQAVLFLEALAKGHVNRFGYKDALVYLNRLLERSPQHPQALVTRARVWENLAQSGEKEQYNHALRDYRKAIALNPSFEARLGLAGTLYRLGRPWDALVEYEKLREAKPASAPVLFGLARCRYNLHDVDEARRLLDEVLAQHPVPGTAPSPPWSGESSVRGAALLERGRLAIHAGKLADAEKWLREAVAVAPPYNGVALRLLCQCLESQHKDEEARRCADRLRESEANVLRVNRMILQANRGPHNGDRRYEIAMSLMRLGREQDGVAGLFLVLEQEPGHLQAHAALAAYFERTGQPGRAARHRRAGLQAGGRQPTSPVTQ